MKKALIFIGIAILFTGCLSVSQYQERREQFQAQIGEQQSVEQETSAVTEVPVPATAETKADTETPTTPIISTAPTAPTESSDEAWDGECR
ncbi:hypothetical protein LQZ18_12730 [Lachnospiraceae bacterium ZAX-1]